MLIILCSITYFDNLLIHYDVDFSLRTYYFFLKHFQFVADSMNLIVLLKGTNEVGISIMFIREYNSLKEIEDLLSSRENRNRLEESMDQMAATYTVVYREVDV